ncbi:UNVERIFIED_CONTAM: hypothetical protein B566_EDAN019533 [Ephemera danica]|nr:hypothetical protein B566_EDAN019533 [Ephemera danica]
MAPLPVERVLVGENPFRFCGVDYFGPFAVRSGQSDNKRYGCLFTCLQTRAVHIEIAQSMNTDSFIMALTRFINRRGSPEVIFSDNGSNFVGAERELKRVLNSLEHRKIANNLLVRNIEWNFNPPSASHRGGIWERVIRSVKRVLASLVTEQSMSDEGLLTCMVEVERILNDRPLVPVYDDPQEIMALCPNDLLLLRPNAGLVQGDVPLADRLRRGWRQAQYMAGVFWRRWTDTYLPLLHARSKWLINKRDIVQGDLVLIVDNGAPRGVWKKGLVTKVYRGLDDHVRRAEVRTTGGIVLRDIRSMCLLEGSDGLDE